MNVKMTLGVLAALAAAGTAANATPTADIGTTATKLEMSTAAVEQAGKDLTVTDGAIVVARGIVKDGPIWAQFHQSKK